MILKISGFKSGIYIGAIISVVIIACVTFIVATSDNWIQESLLEVVFLMIVCAIVDYFTLRAGLTYYTLDKKGITEHFLSRTRTFRWDECRFIKQINIRSFRTGIQTIVCSKSGLPYGMLESKIYSYRWPRNDTMLISNRPDSVYREFLIWCGGERDIRE